MKKLRHCHPVYMLRVFANTCGPKTVHFQFSPYRVNFIVMNSVNILVKTISLPARR